MTDVHTLFGRHGGPLLASLAMALTACALGAPDAHAADRKKVLVLSAFRFDEQFSVVSQREVPARLADGLEDGVDYYTEHLDTLRFPQPEYQDTYLDFLRGKYAGTPVDLLIVMGDDAIDLVLRNRNTIFADTPVVFYALNPPRSRIANSTGLIAPFEFNRSIDLAMALQPDLEHVYVVSGRGEPDQRYEQQAREQFRPMERRLDFTYLSGLVTRDLEERLRTLPPRSAVYYLMVSEDGAGERFQQMSYLARVAAAANAPTYSWADINVDASFVGGSRRDQVSATRALAALALRVLRGERADDIPLSSLNTDVDQVDWRQLRRWGLDESGLPAGVRVLFREPGVWEQYRRYIITAVMLMLAQTALIAGLLVQRAKRQRVELELRGRERELHGSQTKLRVSYERIRQLSRRLLSEQETERARIARELHDDINQQLALLSIEMDQVRVDPLPADSKKHLSRARETAHEISTSVRELSHRLHPARLQIVGLVAGLDALRRDLSPPHLSIAFGHHDVPPDLDENVALCLFRVAQEALANAVKHSDAGHVWVDLKGGPSDVALTITDDGKGFDVSGSSSAGLGLLSMRERVETVEGLLKIDATPGLGTRLTVTVPTRAPESAPLGAHLA